MEAANEREVAAARPSFGAVLAAPWVGIARPEEAGRRMALAGGGAVLASLIATEMVATILSIPIGLWDKTVEWQSTAQPPGVVKKTCTLAEAWTDWKEDTLPQVAWSPVLSIVYVALLCVLGALLVWPRVSAGRNLRKSLDTAGRAVAATAGALLVLGYAMTVANVVATDRMYEVQLTVSTPEARWSLPDDAISVLLTMLSWLCAPVWFVWVARAARGARGVLAIPAKPPTCEGCGYPLIHQSELGHCTDCGTSLTESTDAALARRDTPWDRRPSILNWIETTRLALFHPSKLYRMLRTRGDDQRSGAFALIHYFAIAAVLFALNRFASRFGYFGGWAMPSVGVMYNVAWWIASFWLLHRAIGSAVMLTATKRGWFPPGVQAGKIVDYQVVFLWPVTIIAIVWSLFSGFGPSPWAWPVVTIGGFTTGGAMTGLDWVQQLAPPALAWVLQMAFLWGPPILLLAFWLRRYGLAMRSVRWANF